MNLNIALFAYLYSFAHQSIAQDNAIIFFAKYLPYLVVVAAIVFMFTHHDKVSFINKIKIFINHLLGRHTMAIWTRWKEVAFVFSSSASAWVVAYVLKILFHTPRPFMAFRYVYSVFPESGYAFPSGHATFFSALAVAIFLVHRRVGYFFILCAFIIGIARIVAGVHFPGDILGGFVIGSLIAWTLHTLFSKFAYLPRNI